MKVLHKQVGLRQSADLKMLDIVAEDASVIYIEGYASVYRKMSGDYQVDRDSELVNTDNLDISSYMRNPVIVWNHNWDIPIGTVTSIVKDLYGIYVKGEIHKLSGLESKFEAVRKGIVKSFSIGFIPKDVVMFSEDILEISSAELVEISLAPVQSNPASLFTVTGTKSLAISVQDVAIQNNLTDIEIKGMFGKGIKGDTMQVNTKNLEPQSTEPTTQPVEQKPSEPVVEPVVPTEPTTQPVEQKPSEPVVEPVVPTAEPVVLQPNLDTLSASIADALSKVEEAKELKRIEEEKAKAEAEAKQKLDAENRVKDAIAYIKEQAEKIASTDVSQLDFDSLEDFYEAVSLATTTVDAKVQALGELVGKQ